jgi:signal transduction histidine kinase
MKSWMLESIIKKINRNIIISFLIIFIFFIGAISLVFVNYKNNEKKFISQKVNATFAMFAGQASQRLVAITMLHAFRYYLHSGWLSRKHLYPAFLSKIKRYSLDLDGIVGMDIFDSSSGESLLSYGAKTNDSVTLELCYLNRKLPNFDAGVCSYSWKLYFEKDTLVKELKRLNPELIDCNDCNPEIVFGKYFGDFPISQFSGMKINLGIEKNSITILWEICFFIASLFLVLIIWNVNRIKHVFKKYLSDPIIEITARVKENKGLPNVAVEELSYLTMQIEQWKKQVIELETIKAKEKAKEEKSKVMQSIGISMAHELRTPLRSIMSGVSGVEKFLPVLLENYDLARKANLSTKVIKPQQIQLLRKVIPNLKAEGKAINMIVDMLLMRIKGNIAETSSIQRLSIRNCVSEALQRYSFQKSEKDLVVYDMTNDFQFEGDKILVIHVVFNLLKNALYYVASAQKGQIYIHFEHGENENVLCFKDTGRGIPKETLVRVFERFYSNTEGGVGIGLSFCKMVMEWMCGDITCQSIEGEYAEFILHFPTLKG